MPQLDLPGIVSAEYNDGSAVVKAKADIRPAISDELFRQNVRVHELRVRERSLEEVFLETVYGGASQ
jgi:ABC-2 type transport system ATP-binding protein